MHAISGGIQPPGSLMEAAPRRRDQSTQPAASLAAATPYSNRFGPAKTEALQRFGGTAETEQAVADGLLYLRKVKQGDQRSRLSWWYNGYDVDQGRPREGEHYNVDVGATATP